MTPRRPSFPRRVGGLLIDYALILAWMATIGLITLVAYVITGTLTNWLDFGVLGAELLGFVVLVLPVGIYLFVAESSSWQATVGKRALGMRVVDAATLGRPSRWRILVRTVVKLLPWEFAHFMVWHLIAALAAGGAIPPWIIVGLVVADVLPLVYVLVVAFQPQRRGPHDLLAGTRVVLSRGV